MLDDVTEIRVAAPTAARSTLRDGDVLMTEGGDIDKLGRGTVWRDQLEGCLHQNHIFAVRARRELLDPDYLALLSRTAHARAYFESTGVQSTNLASTSSAKIMSLPVPVLSISEQQTLVASWREAEPLTQGLRTALSAQVRLLSERRQTLTTVVVTGDAEV
jgi:type I restriction enzyme S subunit